LPRRQQADASTILRIGIVASVVAGALALGAWALGVDVEPENVEARESLDPPSALPDDARITVLGEMSDRIRESSGIAVSRQHDGVAWTHNDQGREAQIFAIMYDGRLRSSLSVEGVELTDWEDISLAPCPVAVRADTQCLYIADTGDNAEKRPALSIEILPEPDPSQPHRSVRVAARLAVRYPEGPADTEAMAVTTQGDILLITKGMNGTATLYRVTAATVARATAQGAQHEVYDAVRVGPLPLDVSTRVKRITGAAMSSDGRTLAVRSMTSIYLFDAGRPLSLPRLCEVGLRQPQGEALDFLDGTNLILTSERVGGTAPILRVRCEP
jgi:hypothetical protein